MANYPDPWVDDGKMWCYYNVTTTSGATSLLYSTNNISSMEVDGESVTVAKTYTFDSEGEHLVKYGLTNNTRISVTDSGDHAPFRSVTTLKRCYLPDTITSIGNYCFYSSTNLTFVRIPSGVTIISISAFYNCTSLVLEELALPSLSSIGQAALQNTKIKKITNLGLITSIPNSAIRSISTLTDLVLPVTLTSLAEASIYGNSALKRVICYAATPPSRSSNVFNGSTLEYIKVPLASVNTYKSSSAWSSYASKILPIWENKLLNVDHLADGRWRRRLMIGASTPGRPYPDGAIPAEILFSDGNGGFVDSGIIPLASMSYEVYIRWGFNGTQYPFGYYISGVRYVPIGGTTSSMEVQYGTYYTVSSSSRQNFSTYIHRISITKAGAVIETYDLERNLLATETVTFSGSDVNFSKTFGILGRKSGDSSSASAYSGVGYMKVYGDSNFGSLIADLRPMYYQNGWGYWDAKNAVFKPATSTIFGFGSYWNSEGFMCSYFQNSTGSSYALVNRRWCAVSPYYEMPSSCSTVRIHLSSSASTNYQICFFNSSYSCTSNVNYNSVDKQVSVPSGTAYYRITVNPGAINDCYVYDVTNSEYIWKGINVQ